MNVRLVYNSKFGAVRDENTDQLDKLDFNTLPWSSIHSDPLVHFIRVIFSIMKINIVINFLFCHVVWGIIDFFDWSLLIIWINEFFKFIYCIMLTNVVIYFWFCRLIWWIFGFLDYSFLILITIDDLNEFFVPVFDNL